jgi:hypothetical protein
MIAYADGVGFFNTENQITKKDFYVAHIIQGKLANPNFEEILKRQGMDWIIEDAFCLADLMIGGEE